MQFSNVKLKNGFQGKIIKRKKLYIEIKKLFDWIRRIIENQKFEFSKINFEFN